MNISRRGVLVGLIPLAACSNLISLPGQGPAPKVYDLRGAIPKFDAKAGTPINVQLAIQEPIATNGIGSERIAVLPTARQIDYYANARWTDRAPALIQSLLLQSLETAGRLSAARPGTMMADVTLVSELEAFDAAIEGNATPKVEIGWRLQLLRSGKGRVIGSKLISETESAASSDIPAVVQAFEAVTRRALEQAVNFIVGELQTFKAD